MSGVSLDHSPPYLLRQSLLVESRGCLCPASWLALGIQGIYRDYGLLMSSEDLDLFSHLLA